MKLKIKFLDVEAGGKPIVVLNKEDAEELGVKSLGRVFLQFDKRQFIAIVNIATRIIPKGTIGVYEEVRNSLNLKENTILEVDIAKYPNSLNHIKAKLKGIKLTYEEIFEIVRDTVQGRLSDVELSSFITALHNFGVDLDEATSLTIAMVETGRKLNLNKQIIVDKHSIGGIPGDKTTLLVVPIIAAAGYTIPKTSSRAITSAVGTADRAETLMPVEFNIDEMRGIIEKTNGCVVWGGALQLSPADDIFIQIEYPLTIDPLMLPSIMAKKKAVGATHLVVDIPTGRGTKVKTIGDADLLAKDFIELGRRLNIEVQCAVTYGEQPIGYTVGPALEAKEALEVLMKRKSIPDLIDKATHVAGILLEMLGKENGQKFALEILKSGKAEEKLREIIMYQGGDKDIKPEEIEIGEYGLDFGADNSGVVLWIDNGSLVDVARAAGCPRYKGAGIKLYKKIGDDIKKGEKLFTVFSEKSGKLERVRKLLEEVKVVGTGERREMLIHTVKEIPVHKKTFILER
jgi:AMP phosphorylase